ncbi:MAG TPA: hypothetical protein VMX54_16740 [Vicinamibacteria bacterium]|nr:hypothetical protein [Vicinamibacteria bacterium]
MSTQRLAGLLATALLLAVSPGSLPSPTRAGTCAASDQSPSPHCCFTHPDYTGTCEVEPAKDETCSSILEYLNNPQSQGKVYCSSTTLRGGWKSVSCESKTKP